MPDLGKAYIQIIPSAEGISGEITKVLNGEVTSAGEAGGEAMMGSMVKVLKGVGMAAVAKQMFDGVKAAVNEYADYEQLTGGIETLFGESADIVMGYAEDAYKTAGLSANDYMETVTSFSASLLQSLGGDTAKAASKADMAITDMSDNANKMGSSMESIQNAYQGFAKQNYTMLDNLKLGYGGTKEEMQRLLEDAEKVSGIKYDLSSYADVVDAIHVVQTEMGITGTTAQEASETISGSISSAYAAVSNLVTGLGNADADLVGLLDDASDSVLTAAGNVAEAVGTILTAPISAIAQATDPVNRISRSLNDVADAQNQITASQGVIDMIDQYQDLRAKLDDANTTASEAAEIEQELTVLRGQLATATGNAAIAQGEYGQALDDLVETERIAAEVEKERAELDLYNSMVSGAKDYHDALEKSERLTDQLEDAEDRLERAREAHADPEAYYNAMVKGLEEMTAGMTDGTLSAEDMSSGLENLAKMYTALTGVEEPPIFSSVSYAEEAISSLVPTTSQASMAFRNAFYGVNDLEAELNRLGAGTEEYKAGVMSLVHDGLMSATEGAGLLGTTVSGLGYMMQEYTRDVADANTASESLGGSTDAAVAALSEEAKAAQAVNESMRDIAHSAIEAISSGGNLRDEYDKLSKEMDKIGNEGDETTRKFAELQLAALDLAATNQELIESYPALVAQLGDDKLYEGLVDLSTWLIDNGLSADEWGKQVGSATSGVINSFSKLDTSLDMSLDQMAQQMRDNITAYTSWEENIQTLMDAAAASGDEAQMAFVQYMQDMGIGAAEQVAAMAANTEESLATFGDLFSDAMDAGMTEVYQSVESADLGSAMDGTAQDVVDAMTLAMGDVSGAVSDEDLAAPMKVAMNSAIDGITTATPMLTGAASGAVGSANSAATSEAADAYWVGWQMDAGMVSGLLARSSSVTSAAREVARAALAAAKDELGVASPSKAFRDEVGVWIPEGIAEGIRKNSAVVADSIYALSEEAISAYRPGVVDVGALSASSLQAGAGYSGGSGAKTVTITNNFTVSGAESPEEYAERLARSLEMQIRMA